MKVPTPEELFVARLIALIAREDVAHALYCSVCGLREEALFDLAVLGWTEQSFLAEAWAWGADDE